MTSKLEVELAGSALGFVGKDRLEIGQVTFVREGHKFTVEATVADAERFIVMPKGMKFRIVIEQITDRPSPGAWAYRLISADPVDAKA